MPDVECVEFVSVPLRVPDVAAARSELDAHGVGNVLILHRRYA